jgi:hypothetical protein
MRARLCVIAAVALVGPSMAGCQGQSSQAASSRTSAPVSISPAASSLPVSSASAAPASAPSASGVPPGRSPLPDGVYRSRVGYALVTRSGANPDDGDAGTWTLTVKAGTYRLACATINDPASDCGNDGVDGLATVEVGTVRGPGSTIWFVDDQDPGGYHMTWALRGRSLVFSHYVGFGHFADGDPVNNETLQPWTRIS